MRLPPLRERREDIPLLARHFLQKSAQELGVEAKRLSEAALKYLQRPRFPGQRAATGKPLPLADRHGAGQQVEIGDLPPELRDCARWR
jgi:two-component system nitrogen regulation response regulator GlnG